METLKDRILDALDLLNDEELDRFKWRLQQPGNVEGLQPLKKRALENAKITDIVDQIVQNYPGKETQLMAKLLLKVNRFDLAGWFGNTPTEKGAITEDTLLAQENRDLMAEVEKLKIAASNQQSDASAVPPRPVPPVPTVSTVPTVSPRPAVGLPGSLNREDYLQHSSRLSLDPNTVNENLILSENYRKATWTGQDQPYADHPQRFTFWSNVLSRESLSDPCYFEVEWSGEYVHIAVSYKDINRKEARLSSFARSDMSWALRCSGSVGAERYEFYHNDIPTAVSVPRPSTGRNRVGVFVNQTEGCLCFYHLDGADKMSLIHRETTSFVRGPLYAGISAYKATAEVCEIW